MRSEARAAACSEASFNLKRDSDAIIPKEGHKMQTIYSLTHSTAAQMLAMFMLISMMMIASALIMPGAAIPIPNL